MSVPIESTYATSYYTLILKSYLVPFRSSRRFLFNFGRNRCFHFAFLSNGFKQATYTVHIIGSLESVLIELFVTAYR